MSAPVKHTCPDIDRAIKHLKTALSEIKDAIDDRQVIRSIEIEIDSAIDYLGDLRHSNDELRQWGKELENELQTAGEEINSLEIKLEQLQNRAADSEKWARTIVKALNKYYHQ